MSDILHIITMNFETESFDIKPAMEHVDVEPDECCNDAYFFLQRIGNIEQPPNGHVLLHKYSSSIITQYI